MLAVLRIRVVIRPLQCHPVRLGLWYRSPQTVRPSYVPSAPAMVAGAVQRGSSPSYPIPFLATWADSPGQGKRLRNSVDELGMQWQSARGWVVTRPPQCHPNPCSLEQGVQVTQVEASWTSIRRVRTSVQETIDIAYRAAPMLEVPHRAIVHQKGLTAGMRGRSGQRSQRTRAFWSKPMVSPLYLSVNRSCARHGFSTAV